MPDLVFGSDNSAYFPTKYHGKVSITKTKWNTICFEPERFYYRENAGKIATVLINPDFVRHHSSEQDLFFYYKEFPTLTINRKEVYNRVKYWVALINQKLKCIYTVYPTPRIKRGNEFKGPGKK